MARPRGIPTSPATKAKLSLSMRRHTTGVHASGGTPGWHGNAPRLIALLHALDRAYRFRCQPPEA
jgi:hypothetical protein